MNRIVSAWLGLATAIALAVSAYAAPISFSDLLARPRPAPTQVIAYGPGPMRFGQLWRPAGAGPHPVVVMIHGGCWLASLPGVELMAYAADDLRRRGIAVWNIEYRRVGGDGGGYPGTFQDVGLAVDHLRVMARAEHLDLRHVVAVGHSAGGHLALWAAARGRLLRQDRLFAPDPLPLSGVVSLAGIDDLAAYRASGLDACGGADTIDQLIDAAGRRGQAVYADTSPAAMLPIHMPQAIISGALDPIVPPRFGDGYAAKARAAGDPVRTATLPGAGHFELIDPRSEAWPHIAATIEAMLK
jgi:acetyl esterase/lipase